MRGVGRGLIKGNVRCHGAVLPDGRRERKEQGEGEGDKIYQDNPHRSKYVLMIEGG